MSHHEKLNYVEFSAYDLKATKHFFNNVFNWQFTDFGPQYTSFSGQGLDGGIFQSPLKSLTKNGAALLIFYSDDINATLKKVTSFGGKIIKPVFEFPGGCRFHFTEPSGNEFAVWAKTLG